MQMQIVDLDLLDSAITPPQTIIDLSTYDDAAHQRCSCCCHAVHVPEPSNLYSQRLRDAVGHAITTIATGLGQCARMVATATPHVIGFYGAALGIKAAVTVLASRNSWLRCAVNLRPLCGGHLGGLAAVCAMTYAVDATAHARQRRSLSPGLIGVASRVLHMSVALGAATCFLTSLGHHIVNSTALKTRWYAADTYSRHEFVMVDGILVGAVVSIVVASAVVVFQAPYRLIADLRHALARIVDVDPTFAQGFDVDQRYHTDLLLPLADSDDRPHHVLETEAPYP